MEDKRLNVISTVGDSAGQDSIEGVDNSLWWKTKGWTWFPRWELSAGQDSIEGVDNLLWWKTKGWTRFPRWELSAGPVSIEGVIEKVSKTLNWSKQKNRRVVELWINAVNFKEKLRWRIKIHFSSMEVFIIQIIDKILMKSTISTYFPLLIGIKNPRKGFWSQPRNSKRFEPKWKHVKINT